jgi:hypothetical protein
MVQLEHDPDFSIAYSRKLSFTLFGQILIIEQHTTSGGAVKAPDDVQQCALAAA